MSELANLLAAWTRRVTKMYACDLQAMTDEQFAATNGGATRSPQSFSTEVSGMNRAIAGALRKGAPLEMNEEASAAYAASFTDRKAMIAEMVASGEELAKATEECADKLSDMTQAPWGEPMTYGMLVNIACAHTFYHDGHLTFVQMMAGDSAIHWFDELAV